MPGFGRASPKHMEPHQEKKLDDILAGLNQLIPQVADTKSDVRYLRSEVQEIRVLDGQQNTRLDNLEGDLDAVGKKIRKHFADTLIHAGQRWHDIREHWKFIFAFCGCLCAVVWMFKRMGWL